MEVVNLENFLNYNMEIIKFIFSDFWIWLGFVLILSGFGDFILKMYNQTLRHINIKKHNYPPEHCDVDGILKTSEDEDDSQF